LRESGKRTRLKEVGEVVTGTTPSTKIKEYYEGGTILGLHLQI